VIDRFKNILLGYTEEGASAVVTNVPILQPPVRLALGLTRPEDVLLRMRLGRGDLDDVSWISVIGSGWHSREASSSSCILVVEARHVDETLKTGDRRVAMAFRLGERAMLGVAGKEEENFLEPMAIVGGEPLLGVAVRRRRRPIEIALGTVEAQQRDFKPLHLAFVLPTVFGLPPGLKRV
jgi:hypothetical protein